MSRFKVVRGVIAYRGKKYSAGDLLPERFTDKERQHCAFPHRVVEVPDDEIPVTPEAIVTPEVDAPEVNAPEVAKSITGTVVQAAPRAEVQVAAKATIPPQNPSMGTSKADEHPASQRQLTGTKMPVIK